MYISQDGCQMNKEEFQIEKESPISYQKFPINFYQPKTKLICYEEDGIIHTSLWRRHETWQNIFHQKHEKRVEQQS